MTPHRFRITYAEHVPLDVVELATDSGFGGFGSAYRGAEQRVLFLHNLKAPFDLVIAQLAELQKHGELTFEAIY